MTSATNNGWFRCFKLTYPHMQCFFRAIRGWSSGFPFNATFGITLNYSGSSFNFLSYNNANNNELNDVRDQIRYLRLVRDTTATNYTTYLDIFCGGGTIASNTYLMILEGSQIATSVVSLTPYVVPEALPSGHELYASFDVAKEYNRLNNFNSVDNFVCSCNDFSSIVIPLVRLTEYASSLGGQMYGTIQIYRPNGSASGDNHTIRFSIQDSYAATYTPMVEFIDYCATGGAISTATMCKFMYNNQWYGGLHVSVSSSAVTCKIIANKSIPMMSFQAIRYKINNTGQILNQEINDSLSFEVMYNTGNGNRTLIYNNSFIAGYNRTLSSATELPISVNAGSGGGVCLLLWSCHASAGNATACGLLMIRFGYDGDNYTITELSIDKGGTSSTATSYTNYMSIYLSGNKKITIAKTSGVSLIKVKIITND